MLVRISLYILKEQQEALRKIATSRINVSEHIRRAIDEYLKRYKEDD